MAQCGTKTVTEEERTSLEDNERGFLEQPYFARKSSITRSLVNRVYETCTRRFVFWRVYAYRKIMPSPFSYSPPHSRTTHRKYWQRHGTISVFRFLFSWKEKIRNSNAEVGTGFSGWNKGFTGFLHGEEQGNVRMTELRFFFSPRVWDFQIC